MSRLNPKIRDIPITKVFLVSGGVLTMIWMPDMIMKQATKIRIAPPTAGGITDSTAPSLGDNASVANRTPAATPIQRLVAPVIPLNPTLLAEVSVAMPPSSPDRVTQIPSATSPSPIRRRSGRVQE